MCTYDHFFKYSGVFSHKLMIHIASKNYVRQYETINHSFITKVKEQKYISNQLFYIRRRYRFDDNRLRNRFTRVSVKVSAVGANCEHRK